MIDKSVAQIDEALEGIGEGATVLVSGFGDAGMPHRLIAELVERRCGGLTVVTNNAGTGNAAGIGALLASGLVRKLVCSFPRSNLGASAFDDLYARGAVELELVPQGTLSERIRAGGAGIAGFYVRTGAGTVLAVGKEVRVIDGEEFVYEQAITGDIALIKADRADRWGNLTYRLSARNFGPVMAPAAALTVAEVSRLVPLGEIEPHAVVTPGIFVDRVWSVQ